MFRLAVHLILVAFLCLGSGLAGLAYGLPDKADQAALKGLQTVKEQCDPIPGGCYIVPAPVLQELVAAAGKQI